MRSKDCATIAFSCYEIAGPSHQSEQFFRPNIGNLQGKNFEDRKNMLPSFGLLLDENANSAVRSTHQYLLITITGNIC